MGEEIGETLLEDKLPEREENNVKNLEIKKAEFYCVISEMVLFHRLGFISSP